MQPDSRDLSDLTADALAQAIAYLLAHDYLPEANALLRLAPEPERVLSRLKASTLPLAPLEALPAWPPTQPRSAPVNPDRPAPAWQG